MRWQRWGVQIAGFNLAVGGKVFIGFLHNRSRLLLFAMKILVVKGLEFLLDDDVYERIKGFRWGVHTQRYAIRYIKTKVGRIRLFLHWEVIGVPLIGLTVDHMDRNIFNTQRSNLRFATQQQQRFNSGSSGLAGFKGITFEARSKKNPWIAKIALKRKTTYLGCFPTKKAASDAYFEAAKRLFGAFATR